LLDNDDAASEVTPLLLAARLHDLVSISPSSLTINKLECLFLVKLFIIKPGAYLSGISFEYYSGKFNYFNPKYHTKLKGLFKENTLAYSKVSVTKKRSIIPLATAQSTKGQREEGQVRITFKCPQP
jgi:hypothetical protein